MSGFGETLHQARAHLGVTLKEAEQATRINRHHLAALEEENFSALPPLIYQRGIVRNYATWLQLDPSKLLVMFEEAHGSGGRLAPASVAAVPPIDMPGHWAPNFAIIAFSVVLSAIVFAWVYSAFVAQPDVETTPTVPVQTATPFESDIPVPTQAPTQVPPTIVPTQAPTPTQPSSSGTRATTSEDGQTQERRGDNQRLGDDQAEETPPETEEILETEPVDEGEATEEVDAAEVESAVDESDLTSIQVTATDDIYVTITADGNVLFDGNLARGDSSSYVTGNTFEVYTTSGASTRFTDACGDDFMMGYEPGEATYPLQKNDQSCAPVE
ncbi:MAG: helix-turn-helix domain-containing protein [Chloroflexia bacterium]|nr:helix-turn-helix domain-containing protein [Chloroflexia bacterium]